MISSYHSEFRRYESIGRSAIGQVPDERLNHVPLADGNSIGMLVRHISGNLKSRFTDFLTTDGEKSWRHRDQEFEERDYSRSEVEEMWSEGWRVLDEAISRLMDEDLDRIVLIRGQEWTVDAALARSLAHIAYHVGQIVLLARLARRRDWQWISVPKGKSAEYNLNPTKERNPE